MRERDTVLKQGRARLRKLYKKDIERIMELDKLKDEAYSMINNKCFEPYIITLEEQIELLDEEIEYCRTEMRFIKEFLEDEDYNY